MNLDTKRCPDCLGTGQCPECDGDGVVERLCEYYCQHELRCEECDARENYAHGNGECAMCHGTGHVPLTDADREAAGQRSVFANSERGDG